MKKLLILSALAVLTAGLVGCSRHRVRNTWCRGAVCTPPVISTAVPGCPDDCTPGCTTGCDSCNGANYQGGTGYLSSPSGVPVTTYDSGSVYTESESSRPPLTPEPGNDT